MDLAAISLAALGAAVLFAIIFQFFLWLRVKFEHRESVLEWKGVIAHAVQDVQSAQAAFSTFREAQARLEGAQTVLALKQQALEESFAHFNAKTIAREREQVKALRKTGRQIAAEADADDQADVTAQQELLAQALAAQAAAGAPPAQYAQATKPARSGRLVVKRMGT